MVRVRNCLAHSFANTVRSLKAGIKRTATMTAIRQAMIWGALMLLCVPASAQRATPLTAWAPQPVKPAPFTAPNKPLKKYTDILARHRGRLLIESVPRNGAAFTACFPKPKPSA